jgi:hypothetical protein
LRQVHAQVVQQRREARKLLRCRAFGQLDIVKAHLDSAAVLIVGKIVPRHADNAATFGQRAVPKGLEQRGQEFAPGEVAGAAKQDEVKTHGVSGDGGRGCIRPVIVISLHFCLILIAWY